MTSEEAKRCEDFIRDMNGGDAFMQFCVAMAEAMAACVNERKPATVSWSMSLDPVKNARMVDIGNKIAYTRPTLRGKSSEEDNTEATAYVSARGVPSIMPYSQDDLFNPAPRAAQTTHQGE